MTVESQLPSQEENLQNPAVERCCRAWQQAYDKEMGYELNGEDEDDDDDDYSGSDYDARQAAHKAFCDAMPPLVGQQNIRDFIACVACGLLKGSVSNMDAPRLLYAAQIAVSADGSRRQPGR